MTRTVVRVVSRPCAYEDTVMAASQAVGRHQEHVSYICLVIDGSYTSRMMRRRRPCSQAVYISLHLLPLCLPRRDEIANVALKNVSEWDIVRLDR